MTKERELLKLALEALEFNQARWQGKDEAITAIKEALAQQALDRKAENARELGLDYEPENTLHWHALNYRTAPTQNAQAMFEALERFVAQPEPEPVAWLITDEKINSLQVGSIQRLIDRARHAHMTDIKLRINGQDEWFQADWLKHLTRTTPPQRTWVGLTDEALELLNDCGDTDSYKFARAIESKLKEKNT